MDRQHDRRYDDRGRMPEREHYHGPQRQGRSPPPRAENFRSNRPPPYARGRTPPPVDTYFPPTGSRGLDPRSRTPEFTRRRSRSPQFHQRRPSPPPPSNGWRTGERQPARRWSPRRDQVRRDDRPQSPPRRVRSRSPIVEPRRPSPRGLRQRSPMGMKRMRDFSPPGASRGMRSPPPAKRERMVSPSRGRFEQPRSPPRRQFSPAPAPLPPPPPAAARDRRQSPTGYPRANWQQRSRSPPRHDETFVPPVRSQWKGRSRSPVQRRGHHEHRSDESSARESRNSSRPPLSPPMRSGRMMVHHPHGSGDRSFSTPAWGVDDPHAPVQDHVHPVPRSPPPRSPYHSQSMVDIERSGHWERERSPPPPARAYSPGPRSPLGHPSYHQPAPRKQDFSPHRADVEPEYYDGRPPPQYRPSSRRGYRNGHGAGYNRGHPGNGPRNMGPMMSSSGPPAAPISMSAHNRPGNGSVHAGPSHPRGGGGPPPRRDGSFHGPSRGRGYPPQYPHPGHGRGHYGPPHMSGPRDRSPSSSGPGVPTGPRSGHGPPAPFRPPHHSHNSTSRTYPLTQRFSRHVSDLPSIVPGGKLLPSDMEKSVSERLAKLQQDQRRLEQELAERLEKKRGGIRNWDRLERESARDGLRSELAEQQVRMMSGEGGMGGAAF